MIDLSIDESAVRRNRPCICVTQRTVVNDMTPDLLAAARARLPAHFPTFDLRRTHGGVELSPASGRAVLRDEFGNAKSCCGAMTFFTFTVRKTVYSKELVERGLVRTFKSNEYKKTSPEEECMSLSAGSISPHSRFVADFSRYETALASPAASVLVTALLPVICILLMCFSADVWFSVLAFLPAYGLFWMNVRSAIKHR